MKENLFAMLSVTPRGRYDEHSRKFSLSKKPRFIEPVGVKKHVKVDGGGM